MTVCFFQQINKDINKKEVIATSFFVIYNYAAGAIVKFPLTESKSISVLPLA